MALEPVRGLLLLRPSFLPVPLSSPSHPSTPVSLGSFQGSQAKKASLQEGLTVPGSGCL